MWKRFTRKFEPALPPGMRVYAIGDVHGRLDLLEALFEQIRADDAARGSVPDMEVILLGDLIDRGPRSAEVVRWAMVAERDATRVSAIKGNHEASLLAVLDGDVEWLESWLTWGGTETLESWGVPARLLREGSSEEIVEAARAAIAPAERAWLAALPVTRRIGDYLFVHAGIRPGIALARQHETDLIWIRDEFLDSSARHGVMVVHGHTISEAVEERDNRIGIDTGAYRSGCLTAVGLEGHARWFLAT